jgi:hypothetical protein
METTKTVSAKAKAKGPSANEKKYREAFTAILSFVNDLWDAFGNKKASPLALYHRLITSFKVGDLESITNVVEGFRIFLKTYELPLLKGKIDEIAEDAKIAYGNSGRICLEIQKYFHWSRNNEETRSIIRQHLLTIGMILDPRADKITELENAQKERETMLPGIDTSTKEGQFINDILETAKSGMEGVDTSDPMQAMMGVYRSGAFQKMMGGMQDGSMNPRALGRMMKKTLNALIPDEEDEVIAPVEAAATEEVAEETSAVAEV